MNSALFSGSFDPFTLGHLDIVMRASKIFDRVYVAVLINAAKKPLFSPLERKEQIEKAICVEQLSNVEVICFDGLLVECCRAHDVCTVIRGIRSSADLEYESVVETINKRLCSEIETIYLKARPEFSHISSSIVKELAGYGETVRGLIPDVNIEALEKRVVKHERT